MLFIYWNERVLEHTTKSDSGAELRDGIKTLASLGVCPETEWPYSDSNPGPFETKPSNQAFVDALKHKITSYARVSQTLTQLKSCLAAGHPFVFGFSVYESFESDAVAKTGMVPMPGPDEQLLGGHAVMCVGYNDNIQCFIVRNSWGPDWGDKGYFYMPYAYMLSTDMASDFWMISNILS